MGGKDPWKEFFSAIQEEDLNEAMLSIDSLIRKEPSDPDHFQRMGDLCDKDGKPGDAIHNYLKALRLYEESNARGKAILVCKSILSIDPSNAEVTERIAALLKEHEDDRRVKIRVDPNRFLKPKKEAGAPPKQQKKGFVLSERTPVVLAQ